MNPLLIFNYENEKNMIPKVIHYCWFGRNPLPDTAIRCIESWKKFFPDYEIKEWNEDNFDINMIPYTAQAYVAKKYAFVSDYARFWILYNYGGLYFDTDVEVICSMNDIIKRGPFMGCEKPYVEGNVAKDLGVAPGLGLGVNPGFGLIKEILDEYEKSSFIQADGFLNLTTIVEYTTNILCKHGLKNSPEVQLINGCYIYPSDYFSPKNVDTRKLVITENTRSIHHYDASWASLASKKSGERAPKLKKIFGSKIGGIINGIIFWVEEYGLIGSVKRIINRCNRI